MKEVHNNKILSFIVNSVFLISFVFPIKFINDMFGVEVDKYLFLCICLLSNLLYIYKHHTVDKKELIFSALVLLICCFKQSIEPLMLLEIPLLYKLVKYEKEDMVISNSTLIISLIGVAVYSLLYAGTIDGLICTGLVERNISGELIFILFLIIYHRKKKLGSLLLLIGIATMSRNYLLCLAIFSLLRLKDNSKLKKFITFRNLTILSILALAAISYSFEYAYVNDKISESYHDARKYINIYDYSNYFRFKANTNLIKMYKDNPSMLLTGMDGQEFKNKNLEIAIEERRPYRAINPHNYFFSYLRIYGIFSVFIFIITGSIFTKISNAKNKKILIILFIYANVLGIAFSNYYMYLACFLMAEYEK